MSQLLNSYPVFEGNQVLTSTQLNQLVAYLDEQNRVTRAKLIGTGIVCGLEVTTLTTTPEITFQVSKGMGITSQGYLLTECECVVDRYKPYTLPVGTNYAPFEDPQTKTQDVNLYELLKSDYVPKTGETVYPISDLGGELNSMIVMLFLEAQDIDTRSCLGMSCDDNGKNHEMVTRILLISRADLDNKVFPRTCQQTDLFLEKYHLPEIIMRRVLFDPAAPHSSDYFKFSENYISAIRGNGFVSNNTTNAALYDKLFEALRQTYTDFAAILSPTYSGVNPFIGYPSSTWTSYLNGSSAGPRYAGMQYFYDFMKDMILAYNEFRDTAFELMSECCTNMNCFPRHLLLGDPGLVPNTLPPTRYRHGFTISPAFNNQKELLEKSVFLFNRMVLMTRKFNLSIINNPNITPAPPATLGESLLITPSKEKRDPLSDRSIPYYYKLHEADGQLGTLEESWNFEFLRKYLFNKGLKPLGYGNQAPSQITDQGPVLTPLYYDTDQYNFLRIEGAVLQNYVNVKAELDSLKNRFDLGFDVKTIRLAGNPLDNIEDRCDFDDLRTEYGTLRVELIELMQRVFDRFAFKDGGVVELRDMLPFMTAMISDNSSELLKGSVIQPQIGFQNIRQLVEMAEIDREPAGLLRTASAGSGTIEEAGLMAASGLTPDREATAEAIAAPAFINVPLYAPQRTMAQVVSYMNTSALQLAQSLNDLLLTGLPFDLSDFRFGYTGIRPDVTPGFIQKYNAAVQYAINLKVAYNQLADMLIHSSKTRNTPEFYFAYGNYMREIMALLEDLITDSRYKSLTLLNYTYQYRFQYLKANDQTLFSNFIKKNPGLEHKAGVAPGQTYVMVVPGNAVTIDPIKRKYVIEQSRDIKALRVELAYEQAKPQKSVQDEQKIRMISDKLVSMDRIKEELAIAVPIVPAQKVDIQPYQVIADFTLPYLCCCDCECDAVKHPLTIEELGIPVIARPYYAEYSPGDYAFGKDMHVNRTSGEIKINVNAALQFDKLNYDVDNIRLYLVDRFGRRVNYTIPASDGEYIDLSATPTFNIPNDPGNITQFGTAKIRISYTGEGPCIVYTPTTAGGAAFRGTDSFYYMFEMVSRSTVLARSGLGQITINVL